MTQLSHDQQNNEKQNKKTPQPWWPTVIKILLPIIIIGIAMIGAKRIYDTRPKAKKKKITKIKAMVKVAELQKSTEKIIVHSMGTVVPVREITLKTKVSGEVVGISPEFMVSGYLKKGEKILQLDQEDYHLAKDQKQCLLAIAEADLEMERGRQDIAKSEWDLLKTEHEASDSDQELALRKPQLKQKQASLNLAKKVLEKAELNLSRTKVNAPFNCLVLSKNIDIGSQVSAQDQIATLVATDEFWVQTSIPYDRLNWITIPRAGKQKGSKAKIIYGANSATHEVYGTVTGLLGDLEKDGRMARLLITIKDPLGVHSSDTVHWPILLGDYVRVEIEGQELKNIFKIHRSALRDNNFVWLVTDQDTLDIRKVDIVWRGLDTVLISNSLKEGQRIVTSDLPTPVQSMELMVSSPDHAQNTTINARVENNE